MVAFTNESLFPGIKTRERYYFYILGRVRETTGVSKTQIC